MAEAAARGASDEPEVAVRLAAGGRCGPDDVLAADGYHLCDARKIWLRWPGRMKDFFDRTYYPALDRINGRPYASLICAGSDGTNAARQLARIATGWRLRAVAEPVIVRTGAQTPEAILAPKRIGSSDTSRCYDLGAAMAGGLAAGISSLLDEPRNTRLVFRLRPKKSQEEPMSANQAGPVAPSGLQPSRVERPQSGRIPPILDRDSRLHPGGRS